MVTLSPSGRGHRGARARPLPKGEGFTLLELMIVITIRRRQNQKGDRHQSGLWTRNAAARKPLLVCQRRLRDVSEATACSLTEDSPTPLSLKVQLDPDSTEIKRCESSHVPSACTAIQAQDECDGAKIQTLPQQRRLQTTDTSTRMVVCDSEAK